MRLNRFYTERENIRPGSSVKLSENEAKHIGKVLRLSKGDKIIIFNGEKEFMAELKIVSRDFVTAKLLDLIKQEDFSKNRVEITLFQSLLKAGKLEDILEKTSELGVDHIVPVKAEFSQSYYENIDAKYERFNKIILNACKQSERITIPELHEPISFDEVLSFKGEFDVMYFLSIDRDNAQNITGLKLPSNLEKNRVAIFVGPEGGFSPTEMKRAREADMRFVTVGDTILRSETAAIFAVGLVRFLSTSQE